MKFSLLFWRKSDVSVRGKRRMEAMAPVTESFFSSSRLLTGFIFILFVLAVVVVCFVGNSPVGPNLAPDQVSRIRIKAEIPFTYNSSILTQQQVSARRQKVPPIYRVDLTAFHNFEIYLKRLMEALSAFAASPEAGADTTRALPTLKTSQIEQFLTAWDPKNIYKINHDDLAVFINYVSPELRAQSLDEALRTLEALTRAGIYDPRTDDFVTGAQSLNFVQIERDGGAMSLSSLQPIEDAQRNLRVTLSNLNLPREAAVALYRITRAGLGSNLAFDETRTKAATEEAVAGVQPVTIRVNEGDTLIEPGQRVSQLQNEQLKAYREELTRLHQGRLGVNPLIMEQTMLTIIILLVTIACLRMVTGDIRKQWRPLLLGILVVLLDLFFTRIMLEISASPYVRTNPQLLAILPWTMPVALGPLVVALLLGVGPGLVTAALVSVFVALMHGSSISILVVAFVSATVGIYASRGTQARAKVVRAGLYAGLAMGVGAFAMGLRDERELLTIFYQILSGIGTGVITGIATVGLLPMLESLFKLSTNITLLELTDFNHPLLRRMQMDAPGTYHHSLMVGNLAENAAAAINANALLCRACAYYHDIGKLVKPEYFTENQRDGVNPHLEVNPSMSALVIKAHVKEGVILARQYKLPKTIIDVIREHHGTSLIQYFYYKALERQKKETPVMFEKAPGIDLDEVNESTYRYEGPKPHFKESAIIHLADAVEAASRSLRKVTPLAIDELIDKLCTARLEDGQLDDTPLTFRELTTVKASFARTLMSMLHSRVDYPSAPGTTRIADKPSETMLIKNEPAVDERKRASSRPPFSTQAANSKATPLPVTLEDKPKAASVPIPTQGPSQQPDEAPAV
ncbi:MAG: HDIG domain-containing protein [Verrucomicrobiota bacterium]|nr:HDIG domain-containing protein [Verrucomicrobiota bacterium]